MILKDTPILHDTMEELFQTDDIYQTIVICGSEQACVRKLVELNENEHTVSYVHQSLLDDERPLYSHKIHEFARGSSRVLLMSYSTWFQLIDMLEEYALDRHNLLVIYDVDAQETHIIMTWLLDAKSRGFLRHANNYHIIFEDAPETFSVVQE